MSHTPCNEFIRTSTALFAFLPIWDLNPEGCSDPRSGLNFNVSLEFLYGLLNNVKAQPRPVCFVGSSVKHIEYTGECFRIDTNTIVLKDEFRTVIINQNIDGEKAICFVVIKVFDGIGYKVMQDYRHTVKVGMKGCRAFYGNTDID